VVVALAVGFILVFVSLYANPVKWVERHIF
jgi:hypothetical protein